MSQKAPERHREVIKAWAEGKTIQYLYCSNPETWRDCEYVPGWLNTTNYRVKPEPPEEPNYGTIAYNTWLLAVQSSVYNSPAVAHQRVAAGVIEAYKKYQEELRLFKGETL